MISTKTSKVLSACLVAVSLLSIVAPASATIFSIDSFTITRANGDLVFQDAFVDGAAPPSAPNFNNGNSANYIVTGTAGPEVGGKLSIDSSLGAVRDATGRPGQNLVFDALLSTNIDPANTVNGFKAANTFIVDGLFDLFSLPTVAREGFGIRLSDAGVGAGDGRLDLFVRRNALNELAIQFRRVDTLNDLVTTLDSVLLEAGHDQVQLELSKLDAATRTVVASFTYVDGGIFGTETTFRTTADIFNGENVTRASFRATTPIPLPPTLFLSLLGLAAMGAVRKFRA